MVTTTLLQDIRWETLDTVHTTYSDLKYNYYNIWPKSTKLKKYLSFIFFLSLFYLSSALPIVDFSLTSDLFLAAIPLVESVSCQPPLHQHVKYHHQISIMWPFIGFGQEHSGDPIEFSLELFFPPRVDSLITGVSLVGWFFEFLVCWFVSWLLLLQP